MVVMMHNIVLIAHNVVKTASYPLEVRRNVVRI